MKEIESNTLYLCSGKGWCRFFERVKLESNTLNLCFGDKILHIWRTWRRRRKIFLQVGSILQVESSFNAQMQTQIIAQIQQGTNPNSTRNKEKQEEKKNTSPNWTRNEEKQEEIKTLVKRSEKSVPLWVAELLPLLHQITKIDSGICFGFCVCFCLWVFGARSGREWCCL